jgi:phosphoglycerol transferase MdoB-like AlkP superfamily enzyme
MRGWLRHADARPPSRRRRLAYVAAALALPALALTIASVDQMGQIGNAYADELAGNGLFTFAAAMRRNELDYDRFYATMPQEDADRVLTGLSVERKPLRAADPAAAIEPESESTEPHAPGMPEQPRHVVLIMVESLSAEFVGAYGSTSGLTPNLDRFAREGLKFSNAYATGTRTVRGLEAASVGAPPIPGQSIVRRPGNEHLATVGEVLQRQGYATSFVYGGYGYFDNMNAYFAGNDYHVVDRLDFPKASVVFENVWGVADESLFANVLDVVDANHARNRPSFTHVMTTSNHRPFTYPDGRIDIRSPGGREGGVKYTDWAIGKFIDDARGKPWFDQTLFVIVADHCASVAGKTKLPVGGYRIPLIFYAPKLVAPGEFTPTMSQIDLPPTILDVLRADGDDHFFGRSIFELPATPPRAFVSNYQSLGYLKNGVLTVLSPGRKVEAFRVDPATFDSVAMPIDRNLADETIAYYQTAARAYRQGALRDPSFAARHP